MAVSITKLLDSEHQVDAAESVYISSSINPNDNTLTCVAVLLHSDSGDWTGAGSPTLTGGGMDSWSLEASIWGQFGAQVDFRAYLFRSVDASAGSGTLTFTAPGSETFDRISLSAWEFPGAVITGTNGNDAFVQEKLLFQASGVAAATTVTFDAAFADAGNAGFAVFGLYSSASNRTSTPRSGWTEHEDEWGGTSGDTMHAVHFRADEDSAASATYVGAGYNRTGMAFEIAASAEATNSEVTEDTSLRIASHGEVTEATTMRVAADWDETFEGSGYSETWNVGEVVTGSASLNEDAASPVGAPQWWGSESLRIITLNPDEGAYVRHTGLDLDYVGWVTIGLFVESVGFGMDGESTVVWQVNDASSEFVIANARVIQISSELVLRISVIRDNGFGADIDIPLDLQQFYSIELFWDQHNNVTQLYVDGNLELDDVITENPASENRKMDNLMVGAYNGQSTPSEPIEFFVGRVLVTQERILSPSGQGGGAITTSALLQSILTHSRLVR